MEQPEAIKPNGAYISDHRMLVELGNALHYTGDSIMQLREAVDGYFRAIEQAMERKIEEVNAKLQMAQQVLSAAEDALRACRDSGYYDDEKEEYVEPNCSCEERDVRDAEKEVSRIRGIIEKLERIKSETDREFSEYRQPIGFVSPGGGDGILQWLGESHTKEASGKMEHILEVVEKYLRVNVGKNSLTTIADVPEDMDSSGYSPTEESKKEKFRQGIERIIERQSADNYGDHQLRESNAIVVCQGCGRPIIACNCPRDPREHFRIFNYDLSR
ncbi:MAG: hypothetical protein NC082_04055 [Clostridiales bacterium]|nr:hypothetical protein [Clostridiales bacterium]